MPRKLRKIIQGVTYHCYSRCHGKRDLMKSKFANQYFIESIRMCQEKYAFELVAAETVGNHIHLIIRTLENGESISDIMQFIKARIAEKYNRALGETGAFWNERFGSSIIEDSENPEEYLLWLLWYIGYNPVRKGLSRDPRKNIIGFINCYLVENFKFEIKITHHQYFLDSGATFKDCVGKLLLYEEAYLKRRAIYF